MPAQLTYPGVYIEEIPSGVRTIIGVATSITAFLGRASRGPVNEPFTINSFGDFERTFGGLQTNYPMSYAVRDFFQNGGSQAVIVRIIHPNVDLDPANAKTILTTAKKVSDPVASATDANDALTKAKSANEAIQKDTTGTISDDEKAAAQKVFDAVNAAVTAGAVLDKVIEAAKGALPPDPGTFAKKAVLKLDTLDTNDGLVLEAASEGKWGNNLRARVDSDNIDDSVADRYKPLTKDDLFNLTIRDMDTADTERFLNVTVNKDSVRSLDKVLTNESRMVQIKSDDLPSKGPKLSDDGLTGDQLKIIPFSDKDTNIRSRGVKDADKGSEGGPLVPNDYTTGPNLEDKKWGLFALEKADLFNLLCIPPDVRSSDTPQGVYATAETYCKKRRAVLIVDPPVAWGKSRATAASDALKGLPDLSLTGVEGTNAAIYFPRVKQRDPLSENQVDIFAPCGIVAGIMARTDTQRGVWKAPAGLDASLTGIVGLQVSLNDAENGMLNPMGINVLRDFGILGRVVWGARTLRGADQFADQWKYVPVRRTALFIEESLFRGLQWVVFEPNDEPLWGQIRLNVGAFMHSLFVQGAFQGTTPREAYFVKCDKETTTQDDINKGIVNIVVGFAPLKPAEFVVIKLQQMAGQIQT
jgi:hypothetical protein